jgi:thiol-disulfide isomerase/thioredoxin
MPAIGRRAFLAATFGAIAGGAALAQDGPLRRAAPEFAGIDAWLNTPPLTLAGLRGRVVLVNFWTHSCINCRRTYPMLTRWHEAYGARGLTIIGVHSPEFGFERQRTSVERAVARYELPYPIAQDSRHQTWRAYANRFWPAFYLIDRQGRLVHQQFGEDGLWVTENAIRQQLEVGPPINAAAPSADEPQSPEMYLGRLRVANLANPTAVPAGESLYAAPATLPPDSFALEGRWSIGDEAAMLAADGGGMRLHVRARSIHIVAGARMPMTLGLTLDGAAAPPVTIDDTRLYNLIEGAAPGWHRLDVVIPKAGFEGYAFTFG